MKLLNKTAIVTGANSGMGMATAKAFLDKGATVIMLCRSKKRGREAYRKLTQDGNNRTRLTLVLSVVIPVIVSVTETHVYVICPQIVVN